MRVYQVNVVCGSGSTGRIAVELGRGIIHQNGACRIAYGRGNCAATDIDCINISRKQEVYAHAILTRFADCHGLASKKATRRLIQNIESYSPDLIHLHNIHGYYLNYEILFRFLQAYGKPVVWTMHDCWAFTGHCAHYDAIGCSRWKTICKNCPALSSYPATMYGGNVRSNYERKRKCFTTVPGLTIVTPSNWLKEQVRQSFLKDINCITIPNGIDLTQFRPTESDLRWNMNCQGKTLILGVASVWTKNKGMEDFVHLRDMLDSKYVMCMVGLTEEQVQQLPKGIIGKTRTENVRELAQYYTAADIFLNLTYEDTFPTTNIEALACGTPVITYNTGGSPEFFTEGCGKVIEKGNLEAVMHTLQSQKSEKEYDINACLCRAEQFDEKKCHEQYWNLYKQIVKVS